MSDPPPLTSKPLLFLNVGILPNHDEILTDFTGPKYIHHTPPKQSSIEFMPLKPEHYRCTMLQTDKQLHFFVFAWYSAYFSLWMETLRHAWKRMLLTLFPVLLFSFVMVWWPEHIKQYKLMTNERLVSMHANVVINQLFMSLQQSVKGNLQIYKHSHISLSLEI